MSFYTNLERLMKEKNVSGYQLHKDLGINPSTLNRWKNGSAPTIDKIPQLLEYFNTTADELIGTEEITSNENTKSEFYKNLNKILDEKNIKKVQLEKDLGITRSTMQAWKNAYPSAKYVIILSEYLNVSADELLGLPNRQREPEAPPNEQEAIILFRQLPDREQIKFIGRLEDAVNQ